MSTQQTHEQMVRLLAEEMYTALYPKHANTTIYSSVDAAFHGQEAERLTEELLPAARIAVKHMAEVVINTSSALFDHKQLPKYLKEQGLIPNQEADNL